MQSLLSRELAPYLDEPRQMPSGSVGNDGFLHLGYQRRDGRTVLSDLRYRVPLLVQKALYWDECFPTLPCVYIMSPAAGVVQGDRLRIECELAEDCVAYVSTQSATRVHEMDANYATQTQQITLAANSYLEYLPEPVIPHKHSRFVTDTLITVAPSATLLYGEILLPGRKYYGTGERFEYDLFASAVQAQRPCGAALFSEKLVVEPRHGALDRAGVFGGGDFDTFGNVILITPPAHAERIFEQTASSINHAEGWAAGVSRLPNDAGLIYKIVGTQTRIVKRKVRAFWQLVRQEVTGRRLPNEFLWR